ncbi:RNA polymerase sigma factor [Streptomyces cavernicola]|uniref:Sigma-70 family RNA polymerase sigma factor n=1 Tax=Streptomyces cavernicola TaxID=3043613 RepID=A0ABT6SKE1_9ACTN|nr:sigma-70 family RNA polymerase sigma factor [Streptomyces sp. B-S-A6]MDI3408379.1 sigma-70 family RNA polymerase sigma factor [Streptomyces sp. B-S-A6]
MSHSRVPAPEPSRPGRKLGPVSADVGNLHHAWLMPVRKRYIDTGRTLSDLSDTVLLAKSKLSELLRGVGLYPRWEVLHRLSVELDLPQWPLYRLWRQAALDAGKSHDWIEGSSERSAVLTARPGPPIAYGALRSMVENDYRRYAMVFLSKSTCREATEDAFAILWLSFDDVVSSADHRRYAWGILRSTVMARSIDQTGHPRMEAAAFKTRALHEHTTLETRADQISESIALFRAISRLPEAQLDVMVLRYLCGLSAERVSDLLGVPLAAVKSDERHAMRNLESLAHPPETGGTTS